MANGHIEILEYQNLDTTGVKKQYDKVKRLCKRSSKCMLISYGGSDTVLSPLSLP